MQSAMGVLRLPVSCRGRMLLLLLLSAALLCGWAEAAVAQQFQDINSILGIPGSVGAAWGDYDGDGDADLVLPAIPGPDGRGPRLLRNDGGLSFTDVSSEVGFPAEQMEQDGAAWGDYDNDGDLDLLAGSGAGWPLLFRRDEAGFAEVGEAAGFHVEFSAGRSVSWCDYDGDNLLDAFCSNIFGRGYLMHNNGDGTFTEVAKASGLWPCDYGQSAAWGDYNNDGWPDLLLARMNLPTLLFRNDGDGTFTNVSIGSGVSSFLDGFSAIWGDYDNDGWLDCYVTSASYLTPQTRRDALFHSNGDGTFSDVSVTAGMAADASVGAGAAWADYDNDGWLDLFVSNLGGQSFLYHNDRDGTFTEVAATSGAAGSIAGEAAAWADVDQDGRLDLFQAVGGRASRLFRSIGPAGNWLRVRALTSGTGDATGAAPVRDAIGARVEVNLDNDDQFAPGRTLMRLIDGGSGFCGQNEQVAHCGLGASTLVAVRVHFSDGSVVMRRSVPANQQIVVRDVPTGGRARAGGPARPQEPGPAPSPVRAASARGIDPNDRFDDDQVDASRWYVDGDSVVEAGGEVTVTLPAPGTNALAGLTAKWTLRGPFDCQVDYRLLSWPRDQYAGLGLLVTQPSGTWSLQRVSMEREGSHQLYLADHAPPAGEDTIYGMTATGDAAGTLRLVRDEEAVLTALVRPAGATDWVRVYSIPVSAEEVRPGLACWTDGAVPVIVAFRDFRVNHGEVKGAAPSQGPSAAASSPGAPRATPAPAETSVATSLPAAPPTAAPLTVGVLPFAATDEKLASQVSDIIAADLSQDNRISLVERARLGEVLTELGLSTSGVGDPETAQRVGFLAGARVLVWGRIGVIDQQTILVGSVVGVETGRAFVEQVRGPQGGDLVPLIDQLAARLVARIVAERDALVSAEDPESVQASLNALAEKLKGSSLPEVAVAVEGEVAGSPLASALRTELMLWLVRCGFPVVETPADPGTAGGAGAALLLTAEASVTPGDGYGPLQTARYRLQVRAVNRGTGEVIAVARRAGECAEVTREAASMRGLQAAATSIAAELFPKLAGTPAGR